MHATSALAALMLVATSCGGPSVAPTPTEATVAASPSADGASAPAHATSFMEVSIAALEVTEGPGELAGSMVVAPATMHAGALVWIVDTVEREDETWHLVAGEPGPDELRVPFGWVSATVDGEATLRRARLECPAGTLSVKQAVALGALGRLGCYGDTPIDIIGFTPLGCGAGGSPRTGTPDWLNGTWSGVGVGDREPLPPNFDVDTFIVARAAPGADVPTGCGQAGWFRFRGHHDDPASETCRTETAVGVAHVVIESRLSEFLCRTNFVITDALPVERPP